MSTTTKKVPGARDPDRLNVLVVSGNWTTKPLEGGVRRHVITLVRELKGTHNVSVLVPSWERVRLTRETVDGITVYRRRLAVAPTSRARLVKRLVSWLINLPATLLALRRIVREQEIDVVHVHQVTAGSSFNFWLLRKLGGPPYVVGLHGRETRDYKLTPWLSRLQMDLLVQGSAHVIAVSRHLSELGRENGWSIDPLTVIPNGSDRDDVIATAEAAKSEGRGLGGPYFLMLGRLHKVKGQDLAIQAWKWVRDEQPNVHLVLVGDYDASAGYDALVSGTGCPDRVHLVGRQTHGVALGWLKGATALIQASRSEGGCAPYAVLEAAMLGIPVVASGIASLEEVIKHEKTGLVVPSENPQAIAAAVKRLMRDPNLAARLGRSLSQYARAELTATRMADQYADVYRAVVAARRDRIDSFSSERRT